MHVKKKPIEDIETMGCTVESASKPEESPTPDTSAASYGTTARVAEQFTCIATVKLFPGFVMVITDTETLAIPMSHTCLYTCFSWIPRDTVSDMYNPFPLRLDLWLLAPCPGPS